MKFKNVYIHSEIYVSRHCHVFVYVYDNVDTDGIVVMMHVISS